MLSLQIRGRVRVLARKKMSNRLFVDVFDEWIETYKVGAIAEVTLDKYYIASKRLREMVPTLKIANLDRRQYQLIINEYAKTHEIQTTRDFHHQVKSCIKDLFHDGYLEIDPTYKIVMKGKEPTQKKKPKFMELQELQEIIRILDLTKIGMDWFVLLVAKTGMRYAEALAVTPDDFDFTKGTLTINKSWDHKSTKGGFKRTKTKTSNRIIQIDWQIIGQFGPLVKDLEPDEPIFVEKIADGRYKRVFNSTYNHHFHQLCQKAGVTVISLHGLRHTHASVLLAHGVSIQAISERLGHADVGVTQTTYAHVLNDLRQKDNQLIVQTTMGMM